MVVLKRLFKRRRASSLTGYGLLIGLISVLAIGAISNTGTSVTSLFDKVGAKLNSVANNNNFSSSGSGSGSGSGANPDTIPDAFSFAIQNDVAINTNIPSNIVQITGIDSPAAISVTGTDSPTYRICAASDCLGAGAFTNIANNVSNNEYIQLQLTTSGANDIDHIISVTVGTVSENFIVHTLVATSCTASGTVSQTFSAIGESSLMVTSDIADCRFTITLRGAGGAGGSISGSSRRPYGGHGGLNSVSFIPAESGTIGVYVGEGGSYGGQTPALGGGGATGSYANNRQGGSGGGASAAKFNSTILAIAGGGGGGGYSGSTGTLPTGGGDGTGVIQGNPNILAGNGGVNGNGASGNGNNNMLNGGNGGISTISSTQNGQSGINSGGGSTGGQGGIAISSYLISGGGGGIGTTSSSSPCVNISGGGGGGGYGGGGGGGCDTVNASSGAGGGGYINTSIVSIITQTIGGANNRGSFTQDGGDGSVVVSYTQP